MSTWLVAATGSVGIAVFVGAKLLDRYLHPGAPQSWPDGSGKSEKLQCKSCGNELTSPSQDNCSVCGNANSWEQSKSWRISKAGTLKNLSLCAEYPVPPHSDRSVLVEIEVKAIGLNFADIFACQGLYSATPPGSFIPGLEFSGVITHLLQSKGHNFKVGDKVMGCTRFGGFTNRMISDVRCIQPLPFSWSFDHGASFLCQALTAYYGLKALANIQRGDVVLIHSVAGGVGLFAAQIVKKLGGAVIGTIGSPRKLKYLLEKTSLKKDQIIVRTNGKEFGRQLDDALKILSGNKQISIIMDSLMGDYFQPGYDRLQPTGKVVIFGAGSMTSASDSPNWLTLAWRFLKRPMLDPLSMISANKTVIGFNLIWLWDHLEELQGLVTEMIQLLEIDNHQPHIDRVFPFEQMIEALRHLHSGNTIGKVVVSVE